LVFPVPLLDQLTKKGKGKTLKRTLVLIEEEMVDTRGVETG
jgi:hypothetical protein